MGLDGAEKSAGLAQAALIDHDSPLPVFLQIEQDLRRQILSGALASGTHFPPEPQLAERYGVSRMTLRRALEELARARLIRRVHGVGTIVTPPPQPVSCDLDSLVSFTEQLERQGHRAMTRVELQTLALPPDPVRAAFGLAPGVRAVVLRRLISIENRPLLVNTSWLSAQRFPGMDRVPLKDGSLWKTLHARYGAVAARAENLIEIVTASSDEARLLTLDEGQAVQRLTGQAFDHDGRPLEYSVVLWSGNVRFRFSSKRD